MITDPKDPELRIAKLLDPDTSQLINERDKSGIVAAQGKIKGNRVIVFASDSTIQGGALGPAGAKVIVAAYKAAMQEKLPIIGIWHSGGARLRDGVLSLHAFGEIFQSFIMASGKIPQLSLVLGPTAGGGAYSSALSDIVVLAPEGRIFVTGPEVLKSVTGEKIDIAKLGGPEAHKKNSGIAHIISATEDDAFQNIRKLAALFADQGTINTNLPEVDLAQFVPEVNKRAYDVHALVANLLDQNESMELHSDWAPNMLTAIGRLGGKSVGVIANNPKHLGGALDAAASEKAARFVRMCDSFGIPLIVIADVPGFLPGAGQELDGAVRRGAKLLHAFGEAVVPRVTLITRHAYGGAYVAMNSRALGATKVFAWPNSDVAVMGSVAAIRVLHRRLLANVSDSQRADMELELAASHEKESGGVQRAIEIGVVDAVIDPKKTRSAIAKAISEAAATRGNHGNIPL